MEKKVRPHGENCGCELTDEYSPALGCPNPTCKLVIKDEGGFYFGMKTPKESLVISYPDGIIGVAAAP